MTLTLKLLLLLLLLGGSAFFSASEMSISAANRLRLESLTQEGSRGARRALRLLERYDDALSAILIGNNLCNIGADSLVTVVAITLLGSRYNALASVLTTAVMTLFIIIFCESVPKLGAKKNASHLVSVLSGPLQLLTVVLYPVIVLVRLLIRVLTLPFRGEQREESGEAAAAELQSILETVEDEGVIDADRSELLQSALDFAQISVKDVMTARVDLQALDIEDDWRSLLESDDTFTRIPVYENSIDSIVGILHLNSFYRALLEDSAAELRGMLLKPLYLYKTVRLPDALRELRENQQHLAVVTDEYGGTLGVVTMEDILEQLVGEIWDETDEVETEVLRRPDGDFEVDGGLPLGELAELLGADGESLSADSATVGGWCIELRGAFPRAGEEIAAEELRLTLKVLEMDPEGLRVERVLVKRENTEEDREN